MTFDTFVSNRENKLSQQYDNSVSKPQCVCLIKFYFKEVLGLTPGAYGNARNYFDSFYDFPYLKNNFTLIKDYSSFVPKKGDITVFGNTEKYGHISIALGEGNSTDFWTLDQNWGSDYCKRYKHNKKSLNFLGVLRPKNQSNISGSGGSTTNPSTGSFPTSVKWANGSTSETVYKLSNLTESIGSLDPKETAQCYKKIGSGYLVVYNLSGTTKHKAGFVKYAGGVTSAPTASKTYKNGSTSETIYADTAKKTTIGSLDPQESCQCLGKIDGMYLVCYKVNGTSNYKND